MSSRSPTHVEALRCRGNFPSPCCCLTNFFYLLLPRIVHNVTFKGSLGLMPSASLGSGTLHMYEPIGGTAPELTGKDQANPVAQILSAALVLRYSFNMEEEARTMEDAVGKALRDGFRTADIADGANAAACSRVGDEIVQNILSPDSSSS